MDSYHITQDGYFKNGRRVGLEELPSDPQKKIREQKDFHCAIEAADRIEDEEERLREIKRVFSTHPYNE